MKIIFFLTMRLLQTYYINATIHWAISEHYQTRGVEDILFHKPPVVLRFVTLVLTLGNS